MNEIPFTEEIFTPKVIKTESEYPPFQSRIAQDAFNAWLEGTFGQKAIFINSDEIEKRKKEGSNTIFIPNDLKLEEIPQVLEAIPEISEERKRELQEHLVALGKSFVNSAVYIYEYMFKHDYPGSSEPSESYKQEENTKAQKIAIETARNLYYYGRRLIGEPIKERKGVLRDLMKSSLSDEEKIQVEQWLLGTEAYERRRKRAESLSEKKREQRRIKTTWRYFKALARTNKETESPFKELSTKTRENVRKAINQPEAALYEAIFNEGVSIEKIQEAIRDIIESYLKALSNNPNVPRELLQALRETFIETFDPFRSKEIQQLQEQFERETDKPKKIELKKQLVEAIATTLQNFTNPVKNNERATPYLALTTRRVICVTFAILLHRTLEYFGIEHSFAVLKNSVDTPEEPFRHTGIIVEIGEDTLFIDQAEIQPISIELPDDYSEGRFVTVKFSHPDDIKYFGLNHLSITDNPHIYIGSLLRELKDSIGIVISDYWHLYSLIEYFLTDASILANKAKILAIRDPGQALKLLKQAEELDPQEPLVYIIRQRILLHQQKFREALQAIKQLSTIFVHPQLFLRQIDLYFVYREKEKITINEIEELQTSLSTYIKHLGEFITSENLRKLIQKKEGLEHLKQYLIEKNLG